MRPFRLAFESQSGGHIAQRASEVARLCQRPVMTCRCGLTAAVVDLNEAFTARGRCGTCKSNLYLALHLTPEPLLEDLRRQANARSRKVNDPRRLPQ